MTAFGLMKVRGAPAVPSRTAAFRSMTELDGIADFRGPIELGGTTDVGGPIELGGTTDVGGRWRA
jgi:hypothetical protein